MIVVYRFIFVYDWTPDEFSKAIEFPKGKSKHLNDVILVHQ